MRLAKLLLVLTMLLSGCAAGPDGQRAQELLEQAQAANANVKSATYVATMTFAGQGQKFRLSMEGGALLKGKHAGDQFLRMRAEGLPAQLGMNGDLMLMVKRGNQMTMTMGNQTQVMTAPTDLSTQTQAWGSLASLDLVSCVKKVDVEEGRNLNGEPAARIAGTIDTACVVHALIKLSGLGSLAGSSVDTSKIDDTLGDVRATLFVSDRTHLLIGGLISLTAHAQGQKMDVQFSYRLTSVNEPVHFPSS
jgi:outer membrane lipoprotein-sorting protein